MTGAALLCPDCAGDGEVQACCSPDRLGDCCGDPIWYLCSSCLGTGLDLTAPPIEETCEPYEVQS